MQWNNDKNENTIWQREDSKEFLWSNIKSANIEIDTSNRHIQCQNNKLKISDIADIYQEEILAHWEEGKM